MTTEQEDAKIIIDDKLVDALDAVDAVNDVNRLKSGVALLNTFNYAIQVQAGRQHWTVRDYHRFVRALLIIDAIGKDAIMAQKAQALRDEEAENNIYKQEPLNTEAQIQEDLPVFLKKPNRDNPLSSLPNGDDKRLPPRPMPMS